MARHKALDGQEFQLPIWNKPTNKQLEWLANYILFNISVGFIYYNTIRPDDATLQKILVQNIDRPYNVPFISPNVHAHFVKVHAQLVKVHAQL